MRRTAALMLPLLLVLPARASAEAPDAARRPSVATTAKKKPPKIQFVGTITIKKLKVSAPIYMGITDNIFDMGVGQWPGTAPIGKPGNSVLGGHRTLAKRPFAELNKLRSGDVILVKRARTTYKFVVTGRSIVKPGALWIASPTPTATLTLFTCHPPGRVSHRYIIRAVLAK